jgi:hypothetical protein
MLLTQFSIAVTAVCAILGGPIRVDTSQPAPEGPPEINLEPRDKYRKKPNIPDLSVKFWSNQLCQTSYGNSRHYASGDCIGLQWRWKAVSIQRKGNESCHSKSSTLLVPSDWDITF